jgi:hypothetical protein
LTTSALLFGPPAIVTAALSSEAWQRLEAEGYKPLGYLGLTELNRCVYADHAGADGRTWEGFVVLPPAGSTPASVWEALDGEWNSLEDDGRTTPENRGVARASWRPPGSRWASAEAGKDGG